MKFKKPSGAVVEVNSDNYEAAIALGWQPVVEEKKPDKPKKPEKPDKAKE
jgi:hypothetical protein